MRDLVFHCAGDAQRALAALRTPAAGPPDRGEVTYWREWAPEVPVSTQGHVLTAGDLMLTPAGGGHGLAAVRARWTGS